MELGELEIILGGVLRELEATKAQVAMLQKNLQLTETARQQMFAHIQRLRADVDGLHRPHDRYKEPFWTGYKHK